MEKLPTKEYDPTIYTAEQLREKVRAAESIFKDSRKLAQGEWARFTSAVGAGDYHEVETLKRVAESRVRLVKDLDSDAYLAYRELQKMYNGKLDEVTRNSHTNLNSLFYSITNIYHQIEKHAIPQT